MTGLLEFREKIKKIYRRNEVFILPLVKFLIAFFALNIVNGELGYMSKLDNIALVLIVALMCSFLPTGAITMFTLLFSVLHMYALSVEVALVGLVVYMLLFLLFLRFNTKESFVLLLTALLCMLKLPYIIPVVMGLIGTPASAVSVGCGVVVYFLFRTVAGSASAISTLGEDDMAAKIRLIIDGLLGDKSMLVMVAAFVITVLVVYLIRRMSIDYSWTIAIVAGVMVDLVVLLIGDLVYDTNLSVIGAVVGAIIAIGIAKVIEFFRFCVDYSRTEKVQFEDDEYYYYVKAVPKMNVAAPTKTVKKINTTSGTRSSSASRPSAYAGQGRTVTTVRTGAPRSQASSQRNAGYGTRKDHLSGGKSVTIGGNGVKEDGNFDYEDIF